MPRRFVVEMKLTRQQYERLKELAAEPHPTVDQLHAWITGLGYTVNRSAVYSWLRHFVSRGQQPADRLVLSSLHLIVLNQQEILRRQGGEPPPEALRERTEAVRSSLERSLSRA